MEEKNEHNTIYAFSHVECWLGDYAKAVNESFNELAKSVALLLLAQTGGEIHGFEHPMPAMPGSRRTSPKMDKTTRSLAVVSSTHRKTSVKRSFVPKEKLHWTQDPKNKKRINQHMKKMAKAKEKTKKNTGGQSAQKRYWNSFTPEERSQIIRSRMRKSGRLKEQKEEAAA